MNGRLVSNMAGGILNPLVSSSTARRVMSSTISSLDSGSLMGWLMGILRDGPGQTPGVPQPPLLRGLCGFSLHFPIAPDLAPGV